jgi:sugar lactone lactonase YvrE
VALAPDETYVLVNETFGYRITRLWLQGPRAGQTDRFVEHLPGFPDNCRFGPDGLLWVALIKPRSAMLDAISPHPALRRMVARLPSLLVPEPAPLGWVVALDTRGRVVESLQDSTGRVHDVTCVTPKGDALYLGSLHMDAVARFDFLNQPIR